VQLAKRSGTLLKRTFHVLESKDIQQHVCRSPPIERYLRRRLVWRGKDMCLHVGQSGVHRRGIGRLRRVVWLVGKLRDEDTLRGVFRDGL